MNSLRRIPRRLPRCVRAHSSAATASSAYTSPSAPPDPATTTTPTTLTPSQRALLDSAIRVDQAGEVAANYIYAGQMAVLGRQSPALRGLLQNMWDQEKKHLAVMNKLQDQHRTRPTMLWPVAQGAGFLLGAATAVMGKEAAMACTEAVETAIGEHYDDQLKELATFPDHPSVKLLREIVTEFRDDELEHLDTAVEHDAQRAPAHALLGTVIGAGCKVAIELCKRF